ncbi:sulfatase family protein [Bremerella sp. P1]|uniref:sulfatase family protein n=1 Tax=Bremerella sp. P1 TaxID=3026424 RepID=UPI002368555C|nr:sulfatase-like hydrolase/transferase [Bremerella sp. P1]WDI43080.1 sulfatase-like hydrolase/transferase [Bremerella sp. P1]
MSKAIFAALAAFLSITTAVPAVAAKPNIIIVLTDDQAPWAFGSAVRSGQYREVPAAATPNIDRLASEGAVFRNFFCTTPVCSPARASFMTGRYASELGIPDFIPQPGHKLYDPNDEVRLDPDSTMTIAELLQSAGYRTGLVGKWHLGDWTAPGNEKFHPTKHGFDYFMGLTGGGTTPDNPTLEEDGEVRQFEGLTTDILTDRAIDFIQRNKHRPFFLCLATRAPHGRWLPVAPEDWKPYAELDPTIPDYPGLDITRVKKMMREYLASTSGVDRNLGRLLDALDKNQLAANTIVIFTSDHGFNMGHHGIWHKGNGLWATKKQPPGEYHNGVRVISKKYRPNLYDESLRVPAVVRWPGVVAPGTVVLRTASSLDVFPTLAEVADVNADPKLKGRSLLPLLRGEQPDKWNNDVFAEYDMIHYATASLRCYRTDRYKLVRNSHNEGCDEFFDLVDDPSENNNLINDPRPEIQQKIKELDTLLRQQGAGK